MHVTSLRLRSQVVKSIRAFFDDQGFEEMLTPRLVGLPGQEPYLEPFWTEVIEANGKKHPAALITSPEYAMKKLLAAGFENIYDLGVCFRNHEPWDGSHDPEFLLLEWYRRDAGLEELMQDTENMIKFVIKQHIDNANHPLHTIKSDQPFRRLTVSDAMKLYANVDIDQVIDDREALAHIVREHHHQVDPKDTWDDLFFKIFLSEVEPKLGWNEDKSAYQPTFLYRYPISMAALARKDPNDPRFALRTELYIGDLELANGFAELADEHEQRTRFEEERSLRAALGKPTWKLDEDFLKCLPAMGNAAGIAFGVDRLIMLVANTHSINDILPFSAKQRFSQD